MCRLWDHWSSGRGCRAEESYVEHLSALRYLTVVEKARGEMRRFAQTLVRMTDWTDLSDVQVQEEVTCPLQSLHG